MIAFMSISISQTDSAVLCGAEKSEWQSGLLYQIVTELTKACVNYYCYIRPQIDATS